MFIENFSKFIQYYGKGRKIKLCGFFILSLIAGFIEFLGVGLIYPFILLLLKPENVIHNKYYISFSSFFHLHNVITTIFILGFIIALLFILKNLFMVLFLYLQNKFISNWKLSLNKKIMHYYMYSDYKTSSKIPPSEKFYTLMFLMPQTLDEFVFRIINLVTNFLIIAMILSLLFVKFLFAAFVTCLFIVFSMVVQSKFFKRNLMEISKKYVKVSTISNEKTTENINNIKEIKILSAEDYFYDEYIKSQAELRKITFQNNIYISTPPYVIEILIVIGLLILGGIVSIQNIENTSWMIASYAIIAASIFRITPALNRIQTSINAINTSRDFAKTMLLEYEKHNFDIEEEMFDLKIVFENNIKLENVFFSYTKTPVIKDLNLEIKKGEFIGIIGSSGAGKTTLADIIMGLLPIDSGKILLDDKELNLKNFKALRKLIGYVPQQINILDGSFKRNVGWGISEEKIEDNKVIEALKKAQLYDFIANFDEGINAKALIGSTGLSQGQKQRLAIARALYRNPEILILDEATSSLDVETEHEITKMLNSLKGEKTIVAIAHRLSTLKSCDRLIYIKEGHIVDTGTFKELSHKHPDFKRLIKLSNLEHKDTDL